MTINIEKCASLLKQNDNILILTHAHPDGDTLGCGFALFRTLKKLGKKAKVVNGDQIPSKYSYLFDDLKMDNIDPAFIVSVDVATENLLGSLENVYKGKIDLCIDHHSTNSNFAKYSFVRPDPAACEIIYDLINLLKVDIDSKTADCLFTGISTDTGCFRYDSTTPRTLRIAADLMDLGARSGYINRVMFETKTKSFIELEKLALNSMRLFCDDKLCIITITQEMYEKSGSNEQETDAIAPISRQMEGVQIGVTVREKTDGTCKASIRTFDDVNAAEFAKKFGGGGHRQAAACRFNCSVSEAIPKIVTAAGELIK